MAEMATPGAVPIPANEQVATATDASATVAARMEAFPLSRWHLKARIIVGSATFFDAFNSLSIAFVLPILVPLWHITAPEVGIMIGASYVGQIVGALAFSWAASSESGSRGDTHQRFPRLTQSLHPLAPIGGFSSAPIWRTSR